MILADKADVRRSCVRNTDDIKFDIHDRVNFSVKNSSLKVNEENTFVKLKLYFFIAIMILCRKTAERLELKHKWIIDEQQLM